MKKLLILISSIIITDASLSMEEKEVKHKLQNPQHQLNTALLTAVARQDIPLIASLLQTGANPFAPEMGFTPLDLAIMIKNPEIMRILEAQPLVKPYTQLPSEIRHEIKLYTEDAELRTKINQAFEKAGKTLQEILNETNMELYNYVKDYPLIAAEILKRKFTREDLTDALKAILDSRRIDLEVIRVLVLAGANPNIKNLDGKTALDLAFYPRVIRDAKNLIKTLFSHGVNPNQFLTSGNTPLYNAVRAKDKELVQMLLELDANVYKKFFRLESPLELVRDENYFPDKNDVIRVMIEEAALKQTPEAPEQLPNNENKWFIVV